VQFGDPAEDDSSNPWDLIFINVDRAVETYDLLRNLFNPNSRLSAV